MADLPLLSNAITLKTRVVAAIAAPAGIAGGRDSGNPHRNDGIALVSNPIPSFLPSECSDDGSRGVPVERARTPRG